MTDTGTTSAFPEATRDQWEALARTALGDRPLESLQGRTADGAPLQPIYAAGDRKTPPDRSAYIRDARAAGVWRIGERVFLDADPAQARQHLHDALNGGAEAITLTIAPEHDCTAADLAHVLEGMTPATPVTMDAGIHGLAAAALLAEAREQTGSSAFAGSLGLDPVGVLAAHGRLAASAAGEMTRTAELAVHAARTWPQMRTVMASTAACHGAGAGAAWELAWMAASGSAYLRALVAAGLSVEAALGQIAFTLSADAEIFQTMARIRAARRIWDRIAAACGAAAEHRVQHLHVETSARMMSRHDPWMNMLRTTAAAFAAGLAGAQSVTVRPFTAALGRPDAFACRMARNIQLILRREARLDAVIDPAGGSWFMEAATHDLAHEAWNNFRSIERNGGIIAALESGWIQKTLPASPRRGPDSGPQRGLDSGYRSDSLQPSPQGRSAPEQAGAPPHRHPQRGPQRGLDSSRPDSLQPSPQPASGGRPDSGPRRGFDSGYRSDSLQLSPQGRSAPEQAALPPHPHPQRGPQRGSDSGIRPDSQQLSPQRRSAPEQAGAPPHRHPQRGPQREPDSGPRSDSLQPSPQRRPELEQAGAQPPPPPQRGPDSGPPDSLHGITAALGGEEAASAEPLVLRRLAADHEELRDAADAQVAAGGQRPAVFLACLGAPAGMAELVRFICNLFHAGGVAVPEDEPADGAASPQDRAARLVEAFASSSSVMAVICADEAVPTEVVASTARALQAAGAVWIWLAGHGAQGMDDTDGLPGIDAHIHEGCDVLEVLRDAHAVARRTTAGKKP